MRISKKTLLICCTMSVLVNQPLTHGMAATRLYYFVSMWPHSCNGLASFPYAKDHGRLCLDGHFTTEGVCVKDVHATRAKSWLQVGNEKDVLAALASWIEAQPLQRTCMFEDMFGELMQFALSMVQESPMVAWLKARRVM